MFKSLTLNVKLQILICTSIFTVAIILSLQSIITMKNISAHEIDTYVNESYINKEKELKNYVEIAYGIVTSYYNQIDEDTDEKKNNFFKKEG